jgi:CheY-like chemotaxis protein
MNDDVKAGRHAADLTGLSILVVEDEFLLAEALVDGLEQCGASVVGPVPTVEKALKAVASADRIDFAVLDINLRGQMVYPVADALKERGVPFLFATGYDAAAVSGRYQDVERHEKPVTVATLIQAIDKG